MVSSKWIDLRQCDKIHLQINGVLYESPIPEGAELISLGGFTEDGVPIINVLSKPACEIVMTLVMCRSATDIGA